MTVPIYCAPHYEYMRISDLPEEERPAFLKWLEGQTRPIPEDGDRYIDDAVYWGDWESYQTVKAGGKVIWD